jgi:methylmalonyl-CoA/ethylmalonyl-CoA epimerase
VTTILLDLYDQIEALDDQLISLLAKRVAVSRSIAKQTSTLTDRAEDMSSMITNVCEQTTTNRLAAEIVRQLWCKIIDAGCLSQSEFVSDIADGGIENRSSTAGTVLGNMSMRIDHVTIAVRDIQAAIIHHRDRLGFILRQRYQIDGDFSGMEIAIMEAGEIKFVLVSPTNPKSHIAQYIDHYGTGVQHLAIEVRDLGVVKAELMSRQFPLLGEIAHSDGLDQIFSYRDDNSGMQLEFVQRSGETSLTAQNMTSLFRSMERAGVY